MNPLLVADSSRERSPIMPTETNDTQNDPWLRVFCPEKTCLTEEENVAGP
jgi:hypothetical protein